MLSDAVKTTDGKKILINLRLHQVRVCRTKERCTARTSYMYYNKIHTVFGSNIIERERERKKTATT